MRPQLELLKNMLGEDFDLIANLNYDELLDDMVDLALLSFVYSVTVWGLNKKPLNSIRRMSLLQAYTFEAMYAYKHGFLFTGFKPHVMTLVEKYKKQVADKVVA